MDSTDRKSELIAQLADGIARLTDSEAWKSWLRVQRRTSAPTMLAISTRYRQLSCNVVSTDER